MEPAHNPEPSLSTIPIRSAELADAEEILALQKLAFRSEAEIYGDFNIPPMTQTLESLREEMTQRVFLKAVHEGRIVGSVNAYLKNGTGYIQRLIVHPDHQNHGLGTRIMLEIESQFPDAKRFEIFTGDKSERNLYLYQKLGYRTFNIISIRPEVKICLMEKFQSPDSVSLS